MNRTFLIPFIAVALTACNSDEFYPSVDEEVESVQTDELRTETEAIEIATTALNEFYPVSSRSGSDFSHPNVVMLGNTKSRNGDISNPIYVVNFGNNNGYALVSANKDIEPLLAVTESGSITDLNNIDNPGLELFIANAMRLEKDTTGLVPVPPLPGGGDDGPVKATEVRTDTVFYFNTKVAPRISVKWGQTYPEGALCPNWVSGCVPTAGAQALSFFEYPEVLSLTCPERSTDQIELNWDNLKLIRSSLYQLPLKESDKPLALLSREIGYSINAIYNGEKSSYLSNSTTATLYNLSQYFKNILPSTSFIVSDIKESKPNPNLNLGNGIIIMGGSGTVLNEFNNLYEPSSHAWLIDGYIYKQYTVYVYFKEIDSPIEYLERQFDKSESYSHINWGMRGDHNGYFNDNVFIVYINDDKSKDIKYNYYEKFHYFTIKTKLTLQQ